MKKYIVNKMLPVILGLMSLSLVSCKEDFLDIVNPNSQDVGTFWRNNTDLKSALSTVYSAVADDHVLNLGSDNHRSDISYPGFNRQQSSNDFYNQTFNDGARDIERKWVALYKIVFRANQVIINGERLISTYTNSEAIDEAIYIVAQARFLRGWAYFTLHSMFNGGSVVLFDFVPESEDEFYQPLRSADEIKSFFRADLEYARENLPPRWTEPGDLGRVTIGTATTVLGKSYLYDKDYASAAAMFADVISNGDYGYRLMSNIEDNFSEAGEYNDEAIFEIGYSTDLKGETPGGNNATNVSNNYARGVAPAGSIRGFRSIVPAAWLAVLYKNEVLDTQDPRNTIDSLNIAGFPVLDDDGNTIQVPRRYSVRTSASIALPDEFYTPYYGGRFAAQRGQFNNLEYSYFRKYSNWRTVESEVDFLPNSKSPINTRLIRLADVYLMMAECLIEGGSNDGGIQDALTLVNIVRRRSGVILLGNAATSLFPANDHDELNYTASTLMEHLIYVERPLELALEGQSVRFLDLRRWGILENRFLDLASRDYYVTGVDYINLDGDDASKNAVIFEGINPETGELDSRIRDNVRASQNYSEALHAYYPIPALEVTSNPNLFN